MGFSKRILGSTDLQVGPLGITSSYGAPVEAYEEAFEQGCNYFVWNSFMKGRSKAMLQAMQNIIRSGKRDQLVIAMHSYGHNPFLNQYYVKKSLKRLGTDHIDIMLLGYYSWRPAAGVLDNARKLKKKGLVKHIGMTGHNRRLIAEFIQEGLLDVYHTRYNAVHTGAERDVFPYIPEENKPGIVSYTATSWIQLLDPKRMPEGENPLKASDCYRFVLSNPHVNVCLSGPKTREQMQENLETLKLGPLDEEEMKRIRAIGAYIYKKK